MIGSLIGAMIGLARDSLRRWDHFLFESCDPFLAPVLRIGFALLMAIQTLCVWPDAAYWYSDSGVLKSQTAEQILGPQAWSLLQCLNSEPWIARLGLLCLMIHCGLMLLGCYSRFQVAAIFVWLVSFQNRNPLITDGEDTVFRILAFLLIWLPLDAKWSVTSLWNSKKAHRTPSAKGIDYRNLEDLLKRQQWKQADEETATVMLQAANRRSEGWLRVEDIDNFSCEDLRTIDQLWVKYSGGRFGFSVQAKIYRELGGTRQYNRRVWNAFGDRVGWRVNNSWICYKDVTFDLKAPLGHLPILKIRRWYEGPLVSTRFRVVSSLASRLVKCNI